MLSILERYKWHQFSVVTSQIAGHDDFVQAVREQVAAMVCSDFLGSFGLRLICVCVFFLGSLQVHHPELDHRVAADQPGRAGEQRGAGDAAVLHEGRGGGHFEGGRGVAHYGRELRVGRDAECDREHAGADAVSDGDAGGAL